MDVHKNLTILVAASWLGVLAEKERIARALSQRYAFTPKDDHSAL